VKGEKRYHIIKRALWSFSSKKKRTKKKKSYHTKGKCINNRKLIKIDKYRFVKNK
jgi:hypothetical protein